MSTAAPAPDHNLIGQTIRGCEITEIIGPGTMGDVYRARQQSLNRNVAIKILPPQYSRNPGFIKRFKREARAVARLVIQKKILPGTTIQTQFSKGRWVKAGSVRQISRIFGVCHSYEGKIMSDDKVFPNCNASF